MKKGLIVIPAAAAALSLAACAPSYERQPQPVYEPAPRVEQPPAGRGYEAPQADYDRNLHDTVHEALVRAPGLRGADIRVETHGGSVHLSGTVDSERQRQTAHDVAHSVRGVEQVAVDDLRVRY